MTDTAVLDTTRYPRTVEIHGHRIAVPLGGEGPVLVLIHGMAGSSATWNAVLPSLAERFTVVAPDLPGHGDSDKPSTADYSLGAFASTVRDVLGCAGLRARHVVGQSLGGGVAMQYTYQFPDRCERLVLVDSGRARARRRAAAPRVWRSQASSTSSRWSSPPSPVRSATRIAALLGEVGFRKTPQADEMWRSYESLVDPAPRAAFVRTLRSVINLGGQQVSAHDRLHIVRADPDAHRVGWP